MSEVERLRAKKKQIHDELNDNEHGYCPNCNMDFDGGLIWDTGLEKYGTEERADDYAQAYGATRTTGKWGEKDMTTRWMCPECKHEWDRQFKK